MRAKRPDSPVFKTIGKTPLVQVTAQNERKIWCKLEYLNPSGSIKDRIAWNILNTNYDTIVTKHGGIVAEASSGNTSISLALICKHMGLKFHAFLPATVSDERVWTILAYGAVPRLTSGDKGMSGAREAAKEFAATGPYFANQFFNELNFQAHAETTGQEILEEVHTVDAFVSGVGTGGTILGVHDHFSKKKQPTKYYVPIPKDTVHLHNIGFTQKGFSCLFTQRLDDTKSEFGKRVEFVDITESEALETTHFLWSTGYPVGPASGVNFCAAAKIAERFNHDENIVTVFTDRMERYFSTPIFGKIKEMRNLQKEMQSENDLFIKFKSRILEDPDFINKLRSYPLEKGKASETSENAKGVEHAPPTSPSGSNTAGPSLQ